MLSSNGKNHISKARLRVQDSDRRLVHKTYVKGIELAFVVVVPRLSPKESMKNSANDGLQTRSRSTPKESNGGSDRKDNREAIVGLLISDSVVKGHVMIQLYGIYSQFLDSKRSVATQSRDAKGKRATLA
ncbi:hypothetical protein ACFX16_004682 [Malus domestica]